MKAARTRSLKPRQILLSKRANVFYLEHVRVMQKDDRVVYLTEQGGAAEIESFYNIPERNTAFVLLGKGSSITDAAARRLADSNVILGFVGNGGSPLFSTVDQVFLSPQSEYRPTAYMQAWARMWFDEGQRMQAARRFFAARMDWAAQAWADDPALNARGVRISPSLLASFADKAAAALDVVSLMAVEGEWARGIYRTLARAYSLRDFKREEGKGARETLEDLANAMIDHGNYIAYGYAAVALNALGISFAFPVMHGKTRRGALVFDVADLYKDAVILPCAFEFASTASSDQAYRDRLIETCQAAGILDRVIDTIKQVLGENKLLNQSAESV